MNHKRFLIIRLLYFDSSNITIYFAIFPFKPKPFNYLSELNHYSNKQKDSMNNASFLMALSKHIQIYSCINEYKYT